MKKETQQLPPEIAAEIQRQGSKGRRIVGRIINILLAIAIVIAAISLLICYKCRTTSILFLLERCPDNRTDCLN